jgi:hypothetical protein
MPNRQDNYGSSRHRPISCKFCRSRKLRCSRESPCSNCISRGLQCDLPKPSAAGGVSETELLERLKRLETLLANQKIGQRVDAEDIHEPGSQSFELSTPVTASSTSEPTHSTRQMESLAHDVAWLENLYIVQGVQVSF